MKERPILFSAPMVRAILDGTKTQTRRVLKQATGPSLCVGMDDDAPGVVNLSWLYGDGPGHEVHEAIKSVPCPYGQPGDRLWVRETFADLRGTGIEHRPDPSGPLKRYAFAADHPPGSHGDEARKEFGVKWKPSIHMPHAASRITLEITGVRVGRLQDISEADANAEGCERLHEDEHGYVFRDERDWKLCPKCGGTRLHNALGANYGVIFDVDCRECDTYQKRFKHLWQSINGPDSWDANPWVWVVEFKRLDFAQPNPQLSGD